MMAMAYQEYHTFLIACFLKYTATHDQVTRSVPSREPNEILSEKHGENTILKQYQALSALNRGGGGSVNIARQGKGE